MVKTAVSILQELMIARKTVPKFEFASSEGETVTFISTVTAGCYTAQGFGKSKKEAKQDSAKNLLVIIQSEDSNPNEENKEVFTEAAQSPYYDDVITINAVGKLQEFCTSHQIQWPIYDFSDEGRSNEKTYCIRCQVLSLQTEGQGRNKKQAKQLAAHYMLEKLKESPLELKVKEMDVNLARKDSTNELFVRYLTQQLNSLLPNQLTAALKLIDEIMYQGKMGQLNPSCVISSTTSSEVTNN